MKSCVLVLPCASIFLLSLGVASELPPPERFYNVLFVSPQSTKSHIAVFMPIAEGLAKRGHQVTLLSCHDVPPVHPNITVLTHNVPHFKTENMNYFEMNSYIGEMKSLISAGRRFVRDFYNDATVKSLYRNRAKFDAVIIDFGLMNEIAYPFAYQKPFLTFCITGINADVHSTSYGNTPHMAYVSSLWNFSRPPFNFWQRMSNHVFSIFLLLLKYQFSMVPAQYEVSKRFPELPPLWELERNQSVAFINTHFSLSTPEPLLPGQVEIGCIQCRPAKSLLPNLLSFIDGDVPVVYFALGQAAILPDQQRDKLLSIFSELPYKFLFVYNNISLNFPRNVLAQKSVPQQDVLGHPNVKLFITHGGASSVNEAIYHKTPMLALPICADQPKLANNIENQGLGFTINWSDMSEQLLMNSIVELITNQSYQRRVSEVSALLRDQMSTAQERAVYWTEYVIRHRGATHLRSMERHLTWIQYFHLDVIVGLVLAIFLFLWIMQFLVFRLLFFPELLPDAAEITASFTAIEKTGEAS